MSKKLHNSRTKKSYILKKGYVLRDKDVRFLKAVDLVLKTNKENRIRPYSERAISLIISPDASTISKIRRSQRGVTWEQMVAFCAYFNIDHNYFLQDQMQFYYTPRTKTEKVSSKHSLTNPSYDYVEKVREAMNECPLGLQEKCLALIKEMQEEMQKNKIELQQLVTQARENEKDALKKYISLLEKLDADNMK